MFKYVLTTMLIVMSQSVFGLNCQSLIEQQLTNQLDSSTLFDDRKAITGLCYAAYKIAV